MTDSNQGKGKEASIGEKLEKLRKEDEKRKLAEKMENQPVPFDYTRHQIETRRLQKKKRVISFWNTLGLFSIILWAIIILGSLIASTVYLGNKNNMVAELSSRLSSFYTELNFNKAANSLYFDQEFQGFELPKATNEILWNNPDFIINTQFGNLPRRNVNVPVYSAYKTKVDLTSKPKLSIIINNLGLSERITEWALSLPKEISLSFSPYSTTLSKHIPIARTIGHEVLISIPVEKEIDGDQGTLSIAMTKKDLEQTKTALSKLLAKSSGYVGFNASFSDANYTPKNLQFFVNDLKKRGLILVSNDILNTDTQSRINRYFSSQNYFLQAGYNLNQTLKQNQLDEFFNNIIRNLNSRNKNIPLVVVLEPYPNVISYINKYFSATSTFSDKYQLVPVTARFKN